MIPVEIGEPSLRRMNYDENHNEESLKIELDLLEEGREQARIRQEACKQRIARQYNSTIKLRGFAEGVLVLRLQGEARKDSSERKLVANWGGPFRIVEQLGNGAYRLEELSGKPIPRTWNASHLKFYFS